MRTKKININKLKSEECIYYDKFRNKVIITRLPDGRYKKTTQTNKNAEFEFLGDTYSYEMLVMSKTLMVYWDNYHSDRKLVKYTYGRLFHYRYDEEMNFDGGPDREDILWTLVTEEADSEQLTHVGNLSLLREPFVAADETNWVAAHEYVDKSYVDKLNPSENFSLIKVIDFFKRIIKR